MKLSRQKIAIILAALLVVILAIGSAFNDKTSTSTMQEIDNDDGFFSVNLTGNNSIVNETIERINSTPTPSPVPTPFQDKILLNDVEVDNFYRESINTSANGNTTVLETPNYIIFYYLNGDVFNISITGSPYDEYKLEAENSLLDILGISEDKACNLNVTVGAPYYAHPEYSGVNYPLSFCD